MEIVLGILFVFFNNVNVEFAKLEKFIWRSYIIANTLLIIYRVELIDKKEFDKAIINDNSKIFVVYMVVLKAKVSIYFFE